MSGNRWQALHWGKSVKERSALFKVGGCRLTVSTPVLKAPMVSALETLISSVAFSVCFQCQPAPLHQGAVHEVHRAAGGAGGAGGRGLLCSSTFQLNLSRF